MNRHEKFLNGKNKLLCPIYWLSFWNFVYLCMHVRQEVVQAIVQHHVWTYCSVNSSLKRRAWLATVGCEALLTTTFQHKHPVWRAARLTDMSNRCEPLHHRNKWLAYGCWQAMPKRQAVRIVFYVTRLHGCSTAGGWADSKSVVSCLYGTW